MKTCIATNFIQMTGKGLLASLFVGLSAPTFASELEHRHGFEPGQVTAHQLAELEAVSTSEDNFATYEFKLDQYRGGGVVSTQNGVSSGHAQMAANYGLDPAEYTVAEIAIIAGERDEEQRERLINFYKGNGTVASTQSTGSRPCTQFEMAAKIDPSQCGQLTHNQVARALVAQTSSD